MEVHELVQARCQDHAREPGVDVHAQPTGHGGGGARGFRGRVLQAGQERQDPGMKAAPFLRQGHRARRAIEQPHADPGLEPRHGPAHP